MKNLILVSLGTAIILVMSISANAQVCSKFLNGSDNAKIANALDSVRLKKTELTLNLVTSGISSESLNTLNRYFDIVDPGRAVQDILNRSLYLVPFTEDRRLRSLSTNIKNKTLHLIESRLFRPLEALLVAKYINGYEQAAGYDQVAIELIKLRVDELVLLNIKKQLEQDKRIINPRMKISKDELIQIKNFLKLESRLIEHELPLSFLDLNAYLYTLNMGNFINPFLNRYLERIYSSQL